MCVPAGAPAHWLCPEEVGVLVEVNTSCFLWQKEVLLLMSPLSLDTQADWRGGGEEEELEDGGAGWTKGDDFRGD